MLISFAVVLLVTLFCGSNAVHAQTASRPATQDLTVWVKKFPTPGSRLQQIALAKQMRAGGEVHAFSGQPIVGLGVNASIRLSGERSLARVVAVDDQQHEYLVYETYSLIAPANSFKVANACRETCLLPATVLTALKVELIDATIEIDTVVTNQLVAKEAARAKSEAVITQQRQELKNTQEAEIVDLLNRQIKLKGLRWTAGETTLSRLSYAEKKEIGTCMRSGRDTQPNLQGIEYYKGGILELRSGTRAPTAAASALVESFDWRSRHGANRPGSPYYAGSAAGWMTSIKFQLCGDCWAHSALGATEAQVNLFFNEHIDLNLAEQELVSCAGAGGCGGGFPNLALSYVATSGVVDEACFTESGTDEQCNICPVPEQRIRIAGYQDINPFDGEDNIKRRLIKYGPLPFGIPSWWHAMVLTGYQTDAVTGETVWILKNSWGADWGEQGYGYVIVPLSDMYHVYNIDHPVTSYLETYNITCRDSDGDGYRNWGLSEEPPPLACGPVPAINDCDDSDRTVALLTEDGRCIAPPRDTAAPVIAVSATPSVLSPPNGRMVSVSVAATITDAGSGVAQNSVSYAVSDEYGRIQPSGALSFGADGGYSATVSLQASRRVTDPDGRRYTISVTAKDKAGNSGSASTVVTVPR